MATKAIVRDDTIAYETKVILRLLARQIAKADSLEEAYESVVIAAGVEGLEIPDYEEERRSVKKK